MAPFASHLHHDRGKPYHRSFLFAWLSVCLRLCGRWITSCRSITRVSLGSRLGLWRRGLRGCRLGLRSISCVFRCRRGRLCCLRTWYRCRIRLGLWKFFGRLISWRRLCSFLLLCSCFCFWGRSTRYFMVGFTWQIRRRSVHWHHVRHRHRIDTFHVS